MNKLTKLGRCDSYTMEWLNNRTNSLKKMVPFAWPDWQGLVGSAGLVVLARISGIGRIGKDGGNC